MKIFKTTLNNYSYEPSLRNDILYSENLRVNKEYYSFNDLFDIICEKDTEYLNADFYYAEIGDVDKNNCVYPAKLNIDNKDEDIENQDYYTKILKGDIQKCKKGDIIISKIRPYLKKNIYIDDGKENIYYTTAFICLRPKQKSKLMYYLLNSFFIDNLNAVARQGKGYPTLKENDLLLVKFDKEIIDKIFNIEEEILKNISLVEKEIEILKSNRVKIREVIDNVFSENFGYDRNIFQSIRKGMTFGTQISENIDYNCFYSKLSNIKDKTFRFSARSQNNEFRKLEEVLCSKKIMKLKEVVSYISNGVSPKYIDDEQIPVIKTAHIQNGKINSNFSEFVSLDMYNENKKAQIQINDILLCNIGKSSLGKVCFNDYLSSDLFAASETMIIRVNNDLYNPKFLCYFLQSALGCYQIEEGFTGTTNQIHISPDTVSNFIIPDISLEEQEKIVNEIKEMIDKQYINEIEIINKYEYIDKLLLSHI